MKLSVGAPWIVLTAAASFANAAPQAPVCKQTLIDDQERPIIFSLDSDTYRSRLYFIHHVLFLRCNISEHTSTNRYLHQLPNDVDADARSNADHDDLPQSESYSMI